MTISGAETGIACQSNSSGCPDQFGCPPNRCPDFTLKRHDTKPSFKVAVADCDGPLDLQEENLVLEVNIWAKAKLKAAIAEIDTYFMFADNIGFNQVMVGDIIVMDRIRRPEHMLVTAFDEDNYLIQVQRGYNGTPISAWKKGTSLKIFRVMAASATIESVLQDITQPDGTTLTDQLTETFLVFDWTANASCLPGCYWLEFKLLKMSVDSLSIMTITPSFTSSTLSVEDFGCSSGSGVEWVRRFPATGEGFLIKIVDSPTAELT